MYVLGQQWSNSAVHCVSHIFSHFGKKGHESIYAVLRLWDLVCTTFIYEYFFSSIFLRNKRQNPWSCNSATYGTSILQSSTSTSYLKYKIILCFPPYLKQKNTLSCIWHSQDRASWHILIIKPTRCTNSSNLFLEWNSTFSDSYSAHHQESSTIHTAVGIYYTGFGDCLLAGSGWNILILLMTVSSLDYQEWNFMRINYH
jgi:hypothetical protein